MSDWIRINNEFIHVNDTDSSISYKDEGFRLGLGVFDSMLALGGKPVYVRDHYERLMHDCNTCLLYKPDFSLSHFQVTAQELLEKNGLTGGKARLRTQITAGVNDTMFGKPEKPLFLMTAAPVPAAPDKPEPAQAFIIEDYPRIANSVLENCKRLDYTRSYLARQKAMELGGNEAIMTNTDGNIACATTSNIFIVEKNRFITPPLRDGVLYGVTRKQVIDETRAREEHISIERLLKAEGVFLTNSITGLRPVAKINKVTFSTSFSLPLAA